MEIQDAVLTIAEIAVALAGFTGIVIIFGARKDSWSHDEVLRLRTLLRSSLSALFLSFVPVIALNLELASVGAWELSALVIGSLMIVNLVVFHFRGRGTTLPWTQRAYYVGGWSVAGALVAASFGSLLKPDVMVLLGLLWQLFIATQNFILLLIGGVGIRES